jgi:HAD superfamily hydrolase (TIGR01509 family)
MAFAAAAMNRPELVIFDCDGVLVDSESISNRVLASTLTAEGLPTTPAEALATYQGLLLSQVRATAEEKLGRSLSEDWLARFEQRRAQAFRQELRPVEGAAETLMRLEQARIPFCVASQGKLTKTELTLLLTGLDGFFPPAARFSAHDVPRGKPAPDLFLRAARAMGASPPRCAVVEDTVSGVAAARSAGMAALGYSAEADGASLSAAGAQVFHSLHELPGLLGLA